MVHTDRSGDSRHSFAPLTLWRASRGCYSLPDSPRMLGFRQQASMERALVNLSTQTHPAIDHDPALLVDSAERLARDPSCRASPFVIHHRTRSWGLLARLVDSPA